ncbi:MAG: TatD family hydrolase [Cephaloticoccus sp.]|nr:TatD family hydrolase [Cephaloticoccus sp.]MCF7760209.1 TatD family hydrolase [Cephaloticoccus sp.]
MGLVDTHTHLETFAARGELPATLARARAAGLTAMVTIGTSSEDWPVYREIATAQLGFVHYSVGLHPCAVDGNWAKEVEQLNGYFEGGQVLPVALGECGLDRFHLPKEAGEASELFAHQKAAFTAQLDLAHQLECPLVVHSRGAFAECVAMIDASGVDWSRVVFHCFTEGPDEMAELVRRGGYGSFTGIITYKTAENLREAAKLQGLGRLMIETDAPYLAPVPHRGKPNEPAFVRHTAEYCAELLGVSHDELAAITTRNARAFYRI